MGNATRTVIDYFEQINQIPRCSKQEQQISRWLQQWAMVRGLAVRLDPAGNLVIQVPPTDGFEQAPIIILQGHMDMVGEKCAGSDHDFSKDSIRMVQDGPWLTARETTLGADNGIAIAMALALVDSPDVSHPPLELFFTVDEETGLTGVLKMDPSLLSGKILINLDSEDEGVFVVGCAGGRNTTINRPLDVQIFDGEYELLGMSAQGMKGGHSGVDIARHRANANKVMARLLSTGMTAAPMRLVELKGGTGRNVIPRECEAFVACRRDRVDVLKRTIVSGADIIKQEYKTADPGLNIHIDKKGPVNASRRGVTENDTAMAVNLLVALPSGPAEMAEDFPLLVQTSSNLSMVEIKNDALVVTSNQRSSVPSRLDAICLAVEAVGRLTGATVHTGTGYPSWPMDRESQLLKRCTALYRERFDTEPTVQIMHAGLECGVIGDRCPGMDMISLGPTIENPHSPSERLYLPSVEKVWRLMVALLESFG
ncbi:MAG: aminoacyl-histidine dipeptidase [Desulfosarcina sp.]|nr:aminoacyl-histidine dipeptidase [Desulfosarcina sp.]MBC2741476.1 aminoacyl-histidine dipeptidase [Desulfosarcina sp.]MBC2764390.1 aminoacyl-histidine dipeptidase [Desulfosarcina sp.]